jgi:plasmid stabilization system protein ParE
VPRRTSLPSRTTSERTILLLLCGFARPFLHSLRNLVLFPQVGRAQTVEGVRKLVTRKYPYLVYYAVDEVGREIIIPTVQHPAREREHDDA